MEDNRQEEATSQKQAPQENAPQENSFTLPEEYQGRGWADKIKSNDDLLKAYDNAQSLIGKRPAGIPADNASDDDWNQFYKAVGRPDEPKYNFTDPEGLPEGFDTSSFKEQAASILHAAGLNQKQADKVYQAYLGMELESTGAKQAELDSQFDKLSKEHFGDDFDKYMEMTKSDFDKYVPQDLKPAFAKLQDFPDALTALMSYTKGKNSEIERIKKEYGSEGSLTSGSQTSSASVEDIRQELASLRTSKDAKDFTSPNYNKTQERIHQLQDSIKRHYG